MSKKLVILLIVGLVTVVLIGLVIFLVVRNSNQVAVEEAIKPEEKISALLESINEREPASYYNVEKIVVLGKSVIPDLIKLTTNSELKTRWAAIYALAKLSHQVDDQTKTEIITALEKVANEEENSALLGQIGGALVSLGDKTGLPLLIQSLNSDLALPFSEPPQLLKEFSQGVLEFYTEQEFGLDSVAWEQWWQENQSQLNWNKVAGKFLAK